MNRLRQFARTLVVLNLALVGAFATTRAVANNADRIARDRVCHVRAGSVKPTVSKDALAERVWTRCEIVPVPQVGWRNASMKVGQRLLTNALVTGCRRPGCKSSAPELRFHLNGDFDTFSITVGLASRTRPGAAAILLITADNALSARRLVRVGQSIDLRYGVRHRRTLVVKWALPDAAHTVAVVSGPTGLHHPR